MSMNMKRKLDELDVQSRPTSPLSRTLVAQELRSFPRDASIALIGLRGVGKSTIGILLSSTLRRRLVDCDVHFFTATGLSVAQYVAIHGWAGYRAKEAEVLAGILRDYSTGAVIVCSSGCVEKSAGRAVLKEWMKSHPVMHIVRKESEIEEYLRRQSSSSVPSDSTKALNLSVNVLQRLAARREPIYAGCSNFEFYNMWDKPLQSSVKSGNKPSSLVLKQVEQDVLRMLNFIYRAEMAPLINLGNSPHPSSTAASAAVEERLYTYYLPIPPNPEFGDLTSSTIDLVELGSTADAFELRVDYLFQAFNSSSHTITKDNFELYRYITEQYAYVRRNSYLPIIFQLGTLRDFQDLSSLQPDLQEETYLNLMHHGLRLGTDYLMVELGLGEYQIQSLLAARGGTKIIGVWHEEREGPEWGWSGVERRRMYEYAASLGCDLVHLTQKASSMSDNFAAVGLAWEIRSQREQRSNSKARRLPPLIAYNTGKLGKMSRILNPVLSPVTHASFHKSSNGPNGAIAGIDSNDHGEITPKDALSAIHACSILPRLQFYIFGSSISHSLSPAMHNAAYAVFGMPHNYDILNSSSFNDILQIIQHPSFGGASITLPYKLEIISVLHSISDHAQAIGAVNTVVPLRNETIYSKSGIASNGIEGGLHGDNTDWIGIRSLTLKYLTPVNAITSRTTALIIGTGGMSRAAVYALQKLGVDNIFIWGRTHSKAINVAQHFNNRSTSRSMTPERPQRDSQSPLPPPPTSNGTVRVLRSLNEEWPRNFALPTIIVSCIPSQSVAGMPPANLTLPVSWLANSTGGVCIELAYKPRMTPLLRQLRGLSNKGWIAVDGIEVLPDQGYAQFELFLGRKAPRKVMSDAVELAYAIREQQEQQEQQREAESVKT